MLKKFTKHTLYKSIILHLFPGVFIATITFAFTPFFLNHGFTNDMANLMAIVFALVPIELGVIIYVTKKKTGTYKIITQLPYLKKSSIKKYFIFIPIMAVWATLINKVLSPFEYGLRDTFFSFIPPEYMLGIHDISVISHDKFVIIFLASLFLNGFIAPLVEEIYFRGYLLPRIDLPQNKAIIANAVLFSLYHFFSPWHFLSRVLMMIPLYYWVMKTKNIRFSIIAHVIANSITSLSMLFILLN